MAKILNQIINPSPAIKILAILSLLLANLLLFDFTADTALSQALRVPDAGNYQGAVQNPGPVQSFEGGVAALVVNTVMQVRYILIALAVAVMVYSGFLLVTAQGNEEQWTKAKNTMIWGIAGLALVGLSGDIVRIFSVGNCIESQYLPETTSFNCREGGFLRNPNTIIQRTTLFNQTIQYVITFIKYIVGSFAVFNLMRTAFRMVATTAQDDLSKDKKNVIASVVGLVVIIIADPLVNEIFFEIDDRRYPATGAPEPALDLGQGVAEIVGFTNFIVTIITPIAILALVAGGVMYITSAGVPERQDKAKKIIFFALIGLIIIYGAFAIVSTFITGYFEPVNEIASIIRYLI